jgi:hypothetical protein
VHQPVVLAVMLDGEEQQKTCVETDDSVFEAFDEFFGSIDEENRRGDDDEGREELNESFVDVMLFHHEDDNSGKIDELEESLGGDLNEFSGNHRKN